MIGQLIILTIANESKAIDELIVNFNKLSLKDDKEKFIFHTLMARRAYAKANAGSIVYGKNVPVQGQTNVSLEGMKEAYVNLTEAWSYAKRLGYPSDVTALSDISPFIFGYFNRTEDLFYHFEQILSERPNHVGVIKTYSRLLFNEHQYKKVIELLNRISHDLDMDDHGILILSNYYLKRHRIAITLLKEREDSFIKEHPQNMAIIFCIGAEIAQELFDEELARKYLDIARAVNSGNSLISIYNFIRKAKAEPANMAIYANELYDEYIKLGRPTVIAEQLYQYLNPQELTPATQLIELAKNIMSVHDLHECKHQYNSPPKSAV